VEKDGPARTVIQALPVSTPVESTPRGREDDEAGAEADGPPFQRGKRKRVRPKV
jgi:hypothetical protein